MCMIFTGESAMKMRSKDIIAKAEEFREAAMSASVKVDAIASSLGCSEAVKDRMMDACVAPKLIGLCKFLEGFPQPVPHEYKKAVAAAWAIYWEIDKIFE